MDRAVLILSALLVNAAFAGPRGLYAPLKLDRFARMPASVIGKAERKLDREHRSLREREARGMVFVALVVLGCVGMGAALGWIFSYNLQFLEIVFLAVMLPVRPSWDRVRQLQKYLKQGDVAAARQTLENTPWRHHALLDPSGMARAGVEYLGVQFSAKILAPVLWFCVAGLPGFLCARAVYLIVETLNRPADGQQGFGKLARQVHFVMDYVPVRFAALLWVAASFFLTTAEPVAAGKRIWTEGQAAPDSQSYMLLAVAQVLKLSLGGPMSAYGDKRWWGNGAVKAMPADVARALYLFALLHLFLFIGFGLFF
jgi:adenosylcobinamide-phosphate synthase